MGTTRLADINRGPSSSSPSDITPLNNILLFGANDGRHGRELWRLDPSSQKASLVKDINSKTGSAPRHLSAFERNIYFSAEGDIYGRELWVSDGTRAGTRLAVDLNPGGFSSDPQDLEVFQNFLYFTAETYYGGRQAWRSDGTKGGTVKLSALTSQTIFSAVEDLTATRDQLFLTAQTTQQVEKELASEEDSAALGKGENSLRRSIGTESAENINNYNDNIELYNQSQDCDFVGLARFWAVEELENQNNATLANDWNKNYANDCSRAKIVNPSSTSSTSNIGLITGGTITAREQLGRELWTSNGSIDGLQLVLDINPGAASSNPTAITPINNSIYFSADDGTHGEELWVSDGTPSGTERLTDLNKGTKNSSPRDITERNGSIYFSGIKQTVGRELWRLDPSDPKTSLARVVSSGSGPKTLRATRKTRDAFTFDISNEFGGRQADRIINFNTSDNDQFHLDKDIFQDLTNINLATVSTKRQLKTEQEQTSNIIYFEPKGQLYFDRNDDQPGYGKNAGLFAILKGGPDLTESDFKII